MRIICPNCLAEYEVHASAVPAPGRDVQCSNCGHGWFQPAAADFEAVTEAEGDDAAGAGPAPDDAPKADATDDETTAAADDAPMPDDAARAADREDDADIEAAVPPARRRIDEAILGVLREEAEREIRARRAETLEMEMEADLGLDAAGPHGGARPRRPVVPEDAGTTPRPPRRPSRTPRAAVSVAPDEGEGDEPLPDAPVPPPPVPEPRRDRLPDIEEVTGSIDRSASGDAADAAAVTQARKGGFRLGFLLVLLFAVLLLVVYALAPHIAAAVPATESALGAFTRGVDAARLWVATRVDAVLQAVLARMA